MGLKASLEEQQMDNPCVSGKEELTASVPGGWWWSGSNASISRETAPPPYLLRMDCSWYQTLAMFSVVKGVEGDALINNNGCMGLFLFKFEEAISFLARQS